MKKYIIQLDLGLYYTVSVTNCDLEKKKFFFLSTGSSIKIYFLIYNMHGMSEIPDYFQLFFNMDFKISTHRK